MNMENKINTHDILECKSISMLQRNYIHTKLGLKTQQSYQKLFFLKRLSCWVAQSRFLVLHHCHSYFISPVLLRKLQTEWPLFGCFLTYRVKSICRLFIIASHFFTGSTMAELGITQTDLLPYTRWAWSQPFYQFKLIFRGSHVASV